MDDKSMMILKSALETSQSLYMHMYKAGHIDALQSIVKYLKKADRLQISTQEISSIT